MKFGFFDWFGRVIMLALAGMITLSIIGAIAAIPSGSIETRISVEPTAWPEPRSEPLPAPAPRPQVEPRPGPQAPAAPPAGETAAAAPAPSEIDAERWIESITYILLALAGIAAFATILLWRALGHWRRSADALEVLASRVPTTAHPE
jgi:hypothetical protein